jgi:hypothetical protein
MIDKPIYAVYATDTDRDHLLGYCTGNKRDIEIVFEDKKGYGLRFEAIKVVDISPTLSADILAVKLQKSQAEADIRNANEKLRTLGIKI